MAPDPPVLSQSESKIWLDCEWCVYDQSTNYGRLLVGTTIEVVGMKKTQFGGSGDNANREVSLSFCFPSRGSKKFFFLSSLLPGFFLRGRKLFHFGFGWRSEFFRLWAWMFGQRLHWKKVWCGRPERMVFFGPMAPNHAVAFLLLNSSLAWTLKATRTEKGKTSKKVDFLSLRNSFPLPWKIYWSTFRRKWHWKNMSDGRK